MDRVPAKDPAAASGAGDGITIAAALAERIVALRPGALPAGLREVIEDLVLDIVGLCLAARQTDYVRALLTALSPEGGSATAIGQSQRLDAAGAALVNGTAAHGEDFDDTFEGGPVHAGVVAVPAVFAAAERLGLDGPAVLKGLAVGLETICRLSLVAPKRVHKAGFHPTSVFGAMGAASGVAAAMDLDRAGIVNALGIAGSMASGIIEYLADGSWTKRMHPGWAAQAGLRAALMAASGFRGPASVFEGTHGLFNGFAHTREGDYSKLLDGFGRHWHAATIAFKPYACGTMTHPYIDCAARLAKRGVKAEDVASIVCEVAEGTVHRLWEPLASKQSPPNAYAAKFSTPFCVALALVTGDAGLAAFTEAAVADERLRTLAGKVGYVIDPDNPYPNDYTGHVRVRLRDGRILEERQAHLRGGAHERLDRAQIEAKFFANAAFGGWTEGQAKAAHGFVRGLFTAATVDLSPLRG
ncbi:MAG: MmgE/PrpD family protein [Proteobacteria bacterium]|nr:MmgE/PrpD family protein [Pseudomonadota bacterium]MBI3498185.1 MmgE/PrpD family protein [Pseudomonadota bacterium]